MKVRPALLVWHRWFGLLAAAWLSLLALTGSILVFYDELDTLLNADQRVAHVEGAKVSLERIVETAEAQQPGTYAAFVDLPNRPKETARVFLADRADSGTKLAHETHVFVDPYSGEMLGSRVLGPLQVDRRHLMDFIYGLHVDLHLGGIAIWILGLMAALWILDHLVSVVLSFPKASKWARSFRVRRPAKGHQRVFDLHRAGGLWLFPLTIMLAVSGTYFNWYEYFEGLATVFSDVTPRYSQTLPDVSVLQYDMEVSLDGAVAAASAAAGGADVDMISIVPAKGLYEARVFDERDIDMYGRRLVTVDGRSGRIVEDHHIAEGTAADILFAWQYPLHSGKAFGWGGRLVVFLAGLAITGLCVTGISLWRRKRRVRKPSKSGSAVRQDAYF